MEVHHHSHTSRRKWKHYFYEFLMLFLAVFCGFLAEYQLEHKIEKDREKQYIFSLTEDLQSDTTQLGSLIRLFTFVSAREDSLILAMNRPDILTNASYAYPHLGYPMEGYAFHRSERTIQQLKYAGGLRLIRKIEISNRINEYDEVYRQSSEINGVMIQTYHQYMQILNSVADANLITFPYKSEESLSATTNFKWITSDLKQLKILSNTVINFKWVTSIYIGMLKNLKEHAEKLIMFLKKEYSLNK